ncbi:Peptidase family M23 [Amycolatopsis marina]|uniref:Peptidase family M23 n=1 Tax=Amycolatopsis marina TaxID=490629 RepID=A0A1I0WZ62_9PSEU|nr:M23 family metallopeptidase [Amycolatopsis marina]SFA93376.1 Peptidase family M23 [Amycolatopsis marina]
MRLSTARRSLAGVVAGTAAVLALATPVTATAGTTDVSTAAGSGDVGIQAVNLRTPFDCGQVWNANTRTNHNPQNSVDFQRSGALNKNVRSSAAGTVETVRNLGNTSYGKYIVVRHAEGWKTLYAHLNSFNVSVGQRVSTGTIIGKVGSTGGSTGPHLHYEQRLNGVVKRVVLNGVAIRYFGNTTITSSTGC